MVFENFFFTLFPQQAPSRVTTFERIVFKKMLSLANLKIGFPKIALPIGLGFESEKTFPSVFSIYKAF